MNAACFKKLLREYVNEVISPAMRGSLRNSTPNNVNREDLSGNFVGTLPTAHMGTDEQAGDDRPVGKSGLPLAACVLIYRDGNDGDKQFLAVTRPNDVSAVGMPAGQVDTGETPKQAAIRELYEETGLILKSAKCIFIDNDDEHECHTFTGSVSGRLKSIATGEDGLEGVTKWVTRDDLLSGPYAAYNGKLFAAIGL